MNNFVPECIWIEILYGLPVKSVFRFKCVSRHWFSLISDPLFIRHYQSLHPNNNKSWAFLNHRVSQEGLGFENSIAATSDYNSPNFSTVAFHLSELQPEYNSTVKLKAASNGLLLLLFLRDQSFVHTGWKDNYHAVFNPVTRQYAVLRDHIDDCRMVEGFVTQLDPASVASYRVVCVPSDTRESSTVHKFEVFSSEEVKWENVLVHLPQPIKLSLGFDEPVVCNQILHFIGSNYGANIPRRKRKKNYDANSSSLVVIAYDPYKSSDRCRLFTLPAAITSEMCLGLVEGQPGCFCMDDRLNRPIFGRSCKIWTLKDYNKGEWSLAYNFSFGSLGIMKIFYVLPNAFHPLDSDVIYFQGSYDNCSSLFSFNIRTQNLDPSKFPMALE